ncbi:MAG: hypothetical protein ACRD2E_01285, partial [Terriglobales bacterium]
VLALLAAALAPGCVNPNFLPPGSQPLAAAHPYPPLALARLLPGSWRLVKVQSPPQAAFATNLIESAAEVADVPAWTEMIFAAPPSGATATHPGTLTLRRGDRSAQLHYWSEGALLAMASSSSADLGHEHWQAVASGDTLLLRSLSDGEVLTLQRLRPPPATAQTAPSAP